MSISKRSDEARRAEMPALHDFYRVHQAEGFALLAVNAGEAPAQVQSFIQQI